MTENQSVFIAKSSVNAHDLELKRKLSLNIQRYNNAVRQAKQQFANLELARKKAKNIKWQAIEHLDKHLEDFEKHFTAHGGKVIWADTADEAIQAVLQICNEKKTKQVVKAHCIVADEINLSGFLSENDIEVTETGIGDYIQQLDNEAPYHITTPAIHKSTEDVAKLLHEKPGADLNATPSQLAAIISQKLRQKYISADIGITGADFLLADIGGVCISENDGSALLAATIPNIHIAITGIENVLPSVNDLELFWPLLATYTTGQDMAAYNTIFTGPRQKSETDGPEEMYVILLNNGRTNLLRHEMREGLYCIGCGACLNACPVYKNIGGHTYGTTYSGPIGAVITPHMKGMEDYKHLSYASTICGGCTDACPVKINLHELLLENRQIAVAENLNSFKENKVWQLWKTAMLNRRLLNMAGPGIKSNIANRIFKDTWTPERGEIKFAKKSFNQYWKEHNKS